MSATAERDRTFVATRTFVCTVQGRRRIVERGVTRVREGDPILFGRDDCFALADVALPRVEAATNDPGELRGQL